MSPASRPASRPASGPVGRLVDRWATERVPAGVDYPHVLRTPASDPFSAALGVTLGLISFMVFAPLLMQGLAGAYWLAVGRPGAFADTYKALVAYELPFGLAVGHLGLAVLIPISFALVLFVHRVRPGYLSSVTGRLRGGWLAACFAIAFASLWGVLAVQNLTAPGGPSWQLTPQPDAAVFIAVMLLTTPLQAAAEEYFFRGYLLQALGSLVRTPWFGIVASAAIFTLFHGSLDPALVVDRFAFGVLAGWLVVRTGGLEAGIAAHIANNVSSFALAALTTSMAKIKAVSAVTWELAAWDVGRFALFTLLVWALATWRRPQRTTAQPGPSPSRRHTRSV